MDRHIQDMALVRDEPSAEKAFDSRIPIFAGDCDGQTGKGEGQLAPKRVQAPRCWECELFNLDDSQKVVV